MRTELLRNIRRIILFVMVVILLVHGASASNVTINNNKHLLIDGVEYFYIGMARTCSPFWDSLYGLDSCTGSFSKLNNFSFAFQLGSGSMATQSSRDWVNQSVSNAQNNSQFWDIGYNSINAANEKTNFSSLKNDNNFFGYYLESPHEEPDSVAELDDSIADYTAIKSYDSSHPVFLPTFEYNMVDNTSRNISEATDIIVFDSYKYLDTCTGYEGYCSSGLHRYYLSEYIYAWERDFDRKFSGNLTNKPDPVVIHFTAYGAVNGSWKLQTKEQIRASSYFAIIAGASGVSYWGNKIWLQAPPDQFGVSVNDTRAAYYNNLAGELTSSSMQKILLLPILNHSWNGAVVWDQKVNFSNNPTRQIYVNDSPLPNRNQLAYAWKHNSTSGKYYLIAVNKANSSINTNINITGLSGVYNASTLGQDGTGSSAPNRTFTLTNGNFTDSFDAYAAHIYEISNGSSSSSSSTSDSVCQDGGDGYWKVGVFCDNFADGNYNNWSLYTYWTSGNSTDGTWSATNGYLSLSGGTSGKWHGLKTNSTLSDNVSILADVNIVGTSEYNALFWDIGSGKDWVNFIDRNDSGNSNYHIRYNNSGSDVQVVENYNIGSVISADTIYSYKTQLFGGTYKYYVNNSLKNTSSGNIRTYGNNKIGVGAYTFTGGEIRFDNIRAVSLDSSGNEILTGNYTTNYNQSAGLTTSRIGVFALTPTNTNYSVLYRQNGTGVFVTLATDQTGNQTFPVPTKYQNTDVRIILYANATTTPSLIQVSYYPNSIPNIQYISPTPENSTTNTTYSIPVNTSVNDSDNDYITSVLQWTGSLVRWFRMNETSGTAVVDYSGKNLNGTANTAVVSTSGKLGDALVFNGASTYINLGSDQSMNSSAYTMSAWFKTSAASPDDAYGNTIILARRTSTNTKFGLMMKGNTPTLKWADSGTTLRYLNAVSTANDGSWHQVVGTTDGTTFKIYLDGVLKNSTTSSLTSLYNDVVVGKVATSGFFDGSLDEITIYNRAISQNEVNASYNASAYSLDTVFAVSSAMSYNATAYVQDSAGAVNNTETRYWTVTSTPPPPSPINLIFTYGANWIMYAWSAGAGIVTDSYNILLNGVWYNGTVPALINISATIDGWWNISVFSVNGTVVNTTALSGQNYFDYDESEGMYRQVIASDVNRSVNTTQSATTGAAYILVSNLSIPYNISGTVRLQFEYSKSDCSSCWYYINKSGSQIVVPEQLTTTGWQTKINDVVITLNTTDNLTLWGRDSGGATHMSVKNFILRYNETGYYILTTGNVTSLKRINWTNDTNSIYIGGAFNPQTIIQFYANITSLSTRSDPYQINTTSLVGWWHFDDNLTDVSGNNNNATIADNGTLSSAKATWSTSGYSGNGLYLNGTPATSTDDGYINTSTVNDGNIRLNLSKGFSISMWARITDNGRYNALFGKTTSGAIAYPFDCWTETGQSNLYCWLGNGSTQTGYSVSSAITFGAWQQWTIVYDNSINQILFYRNGTLVSNQANTQAVSDGDVPLRIGTRGDLYTKMLGTIDGVYLYNDILTVTEVANMYNNSYPSDNLIFHYDLNETSGAIAHDVQTPSYAHAKFNNATVLDINGTLHERVLNSDALRINTSINIDVWFNLSSVSGSQELIEKGDAGNNRDYFVRTNGDEIDFGYWNGSAWNIYTSNNANLSTNKWYYLTVSNTFGTGSSIVMYLNGGQLTGSWVYGNGNSVNILTNNNIHIGRLYDNSERLNGQIDELRIYNRVKNLTEHQQDFSTRLEQFKVKSEQTSTWSSYWNSSANNSIQIPYEPGVLISYVNLSSLPSSLTQNGVTIYDYYLSTLFKIDIIIDGLTTPLTVSYVSPTKMNTTETRNQNWTQIKINSSVSLDNATLFIRRHYADKYNDPYSIYLMNNISSTVWNYTIYDLWDDNYYYYVTANSSNESFTLPHKYVRIDLWFPSRYSDGQDTMNNMYLWRNDSDSTLYRSEPETTKTISGWSRIEQEYHIWKIPTPSGWTENKKIIQCYNTTSGYRDEDNATCAGSETTVDNSWYISSIYNVHSVPVWRYKNAAGKYATFVERTNIPGTYTQDKLLGYSTPGLLNEEDMVWLENSMIKVGINKRYGGAIEWLSLPNSSVNLANTGDTGGAIQNSYWDASTTPWYSGTYPAIYGWEPVLEGSIYNEPSIVINYENTSTTFSALVNATNFFTDYGNQFTDLQIYVTYTLDPVNPVVIANYTYVHYGNHTHTAALQEIPAMSMIGNLSTAWFRNSTSLYLSTPDYQSRKYCSDGGEWGCVWAGIFNSSDFGVGLWNWGRPNMAMQNFSLTPGDFASSYLSAQPVFSIFPYNTTGTDEYCFGDGCVNASWTGTNVARIYVGNRTAMDAYFTSLEFEIVFDPITEVNQTISDRSYLNVKVNTTDMGKIKNSTLVWINSTGTYYISMIVDELGSSSSLNMTGLNAYNYSYKVLANSTTGATASTPIVWSNIIDTVSPASITNLQNSTGTTYINWTWTDPIDSDFSHVLVWLNNVSQMNVSAGVQYLNASGLIPNTEYTISTHTVDTSGNVNSTWVNQTTWTSSDVQVTDYTKVDWVAWWD